MKEYNVCIFESVKSKRRFLESTDEKIPSKLREINKSRKESWFVANRPFKAIWHEKYNSKAEADERLEELKNEERVSLFDLKDVV